MPGSRPPKVELTTKWTTEGPFFTRDPRKTIRANIGDFLDEAAAAMQSDVRQVIASASGSMPGYTGWSLDRTIGRRRSYRTGKVWQLWAVVSANTDGLDRRAAIRTKAAAATIERRWHPYRRSTSAARKALRSLDLTRGLE